MVSNADNVPTTRRPRSRRGLLIVVVLLIAAIAVVVFHVKNRKPAHLGLPPQVVTTAKAQLGEMPVILKQLGTVTPTATVTVLPQLSGYLTEVAYQEGQQVSKGQFLAQIDPRQYQIDKMQAQAQLAKDQASLDQARTDLARYVQLHQQKSIADQTYVDQKFTVAQAEAAVKADQAAIAQDDLDLTYCHITAPVAGRVGLRLVDAGNYVTASSSPGIVVITSIKPTTVEFTVPQNSLTQVLQRFQSGAKLSVSAYDSDNSKQLGVGTVYALSNQTATGTGTTQLRASFANDDEALYPNEFVNVQLLVDTLQNAVLVPTAAIQTGSPGTYVYLVNPDQTVSVHKVAIGPSNGPQTAVLSGLSADQTVVVDGMDRLSDGAKIKIAGAKPASASSAAGAASSGGWSHGGKHHHGAATAGSAS